MLGFNNRIVWLPVKNTTAETIPGGALMRVTAPGQDEDGNWLVAKPNADSDLTAIVNGEAEIPPGAVGVGHRDSMAVLVYDTTENGPITGDKYGTKSGSWYASKDKAGFTIDSAGNGRAIATREGGGGEGESDPVGGMKSKAVRVTGSLVTATSPMLDYYPGTVEDAANGGPWATGIVCRIVNVGLNPLNNGQRYPGVKIGFIAANPPSIPNPIPIYAARDDGLDLTSTTCVKFLKDISISCDPYGNLSVTKTFGWLIAPSGWLFTSAQPGCPS